MPGRGVCDPQIRIYDGVAWMYATHDASPQATSFRMDDWQIWRSADLVDWQLAGTLQPEQTYFGKPSRQCWATDAISRNGRYYLYFSMGPQETGVVVGDTPAGPWRDPLGHALIAKGQTPTQARDPGILQEPDGTTYMVFGTFDYYMGEHASPRREAINPTSDIKPSGRSLSRVPRRVHRRGCLYRGAVFSFLAIRPHQQGIQHKDQGIVAGTENDRNRKDSERAIA